MLPLGFRKITKCGLICTIELFCSSVVSICHYYELSSVAFVLRYNLNTVQCTNFVLKSVLLVLSGYTYCQYYFYNHLIFKRILVPFASF